MGCAGLFAHQRALPPRTVVCESHCKFRPAFVEEVNDASAYESAATTEAGNRAIKDGTLPDIIRKTLETVQAEAAYFTTMNGQRTMIAVFDLKTTADIPRIWRAAVHRAKRID